MMILIQYIRSSTALHAVQSKSLNGKRQRSFCLGELKTLAFSGVSQHHFPMEWHTHTLLDSGVAFSGQFTSECETDAAIIIELAM